MRAVSAPADSGWHEWMAEVRATVALAVPLVLSQLAAMALFTTDVVMMGWLGPEALAAGSLSTSLFHPLYVGGLGVVAATSALVAQAIGARTAKAVRRITRQGLWVAMVMSALIMPLALYAEPAFLMLGQDPKASALAASYLRYAVLGVPFGLGLVVMRGLLQAKGDVNLVLLVALTGVLVNALADYGLMFGHFGLPNLGLAGAGIATSTVNFVMFGFAALFVARHRRYRRYNVFVRIWKPDWRRFVQIVRLGVPIGMTLVSEVGLFGVAVIMMGWLGVNEVAAHAVALQCAALSFTLPLGLSQATTVRVGLVAGANNRRGVGFAGWVSFALSLVLMSGVAIMFLLIPDRLVGFFIDPGVVANRVPFQLAIAYLTVAAFFQLFDGTQVTMAAALRGLNDTRFTMITALIGYWIVGLSIAYVAGFWYGLGGVGIWMGLAAGLAFVAIVLTIRFSLRDRLRLLEKVQTA